MNLFRKDKRKKYLKLTGIKYGKEEMKEINEILKTDMSLEAFKICVTPMIDEERLKKLSHSLMRSQNLQKNNILVPLKAEQIKELRKGIEKLSYEKVEMYKNPKLSGKDMKIIRECLERRDKIKYPYTPAVERMLRYKGKQLEAFLKFEELKWSEKDISNNGGNFEEIYANLPGEVKKELTVNEEYQYSKNLTETEEDRLKDTDGDGLTDIEEKYIYMTDERSKDTDGDGKSDYEEVKIKNTNPRDRKKDKELER